MARAKRKLNYAELEEKYGATLGGPSGIRIPRERPLSSGRQQSTSRQLQGRYLGLIRQIPEGRRSAFAKLARQRGPKAAIEAMQAGLRK